MLNRKFEITSKDNPFLLLPSIASKLSVSKYEILEIIKRDDFPRPLVLAKKLMVWSTEEVDAWMRKQVENAQCHKFN